MGQPDFFCWSKHDFVHFRTSVKFEYQMSNGSFLGKLYSMQYLGHISLFTWDSRLPGHLEFSLAALSDELLQSMSPLLAGHLWVPRRCVWAFSLCPGFQSIWQLSVMFVFWFISFFTDNIVLFSSWYCLFLFVFSGFWESSGVKMHFLASLTGSLCFFM